MLFVPVVNHQNKPLMPTKPSRARKWIKSGKATGFFKKGVFCVRLNIETLEDVQPIAVGVDPGSKKEAYTVKSASSTYLNIQAGAVTWVKDAVEQRKNARRNRRNRKTPCRKPRWNRAIGGLSPSTKARWQWKIRILNWLYKIFPISNIIVEDITAVTKGQRRWDKSFSPLQIGKTWFYEQLENLILKSGWETKELRDSAGLHKTSDKMSKSFDAHCVDSWVLANHIVGGHVKPDNKQILYIRPLRFYRRQLHVFCYAKGGKRKRHGGTISLGFKRGSLVRHNKLGIVYVGGTSNDRISLHSVETSERLGKNFKIEDCNLLSYNTWTFALV